MHCYILNIEACRFMVSKDFLKSYSPLYGKTMEDKDPEGLANLEPRDMVGMIYVGDHLHCYILVYKLWALWLGIKDFLSFSNYKSMRAIDLHVHDKFSLKGLDWQDLCRGKLDILNI